MRRVSLAALAATAAISCASPAVAATQLNPDVSGTPDSYQIYGIGPNTGNVVYGSSPDNTTTPNVTFDAGVGSTVQVDINNGFAQITPGSGTWTQLIINPDLLFTDMKFAISLVGGSGTVNVYYLLAGGPTSAADNPANYTLCATCSFTADGSDKNFELSGDTFNGVMFQVTGTGLTFGTFKQMSYEPFVGPGGVPEPSAWAMMLLGFGAMGLAIRRRRRPTLAQLA